MTTRIASSVVIATLLIGVSTSAQSPTRQSPLAGRFMDPANGLSLEQAIARAIEQEPSPRAARSQLDEAKGTKIQASLRPNPSVSFDRREEPGGTDSLTTVGVEWPLDLFRRDIVDRADETTVAGQTAHRRDVTREAEVADKRALALSGRLRLASHIRQCEPEEHVALGILGRSLQLLLHRQPC